MISLELKAAFSESNQSSENLESDIALTFSEFFGDPQNQENLPFFTQKLQEYFEHFSEDQKAQKMNQISSTASKFLTKSIEEILNECPKEYRNLLSFHRYHHQEKLRKRLGESIIKRRYSLSALSHLQSDDLSAYDSSHSQKANIFYQNIGLFYDNQVASPLIRILLNS